LDVEELIARTEIMDVLYRYCRAVDRGDVHELRLTYHPDGTDTHGSFDGLGTDFAPYIVDKMDAAELLGQHHITNAIIELDGDQARVESYFLAVQPYNDADGRHLLGLIGGRYLDVFARRAGRWAVARRTVVLDWSRAEIAGDDWPGQLAYPLAGRRGDDPSAGFFTRTR
jgi:hypothetical protein